MASVAQSGDYLVTKKRKVMKVLNSKTDDEKGSPPEKNMKLYLKYLG